MMVSHRADRGWCVAVRCEVTRRFSNTRGAAVLRRARGRQRPARPAARRSPLRAHQSGAGRRAAARPPRRVGRHRLATYALHRPGSARVHPPGGHLLLVEHGPSRSGWLRAAQHVLNPSTVRERDRQIMTSSVSWSLQRWLVGTRRGHARWGRALAAGTPARRWVAPPRADRS
jgi:hypothetical protein